MTKIKIFIYILCMQVICAQGYKHGELKTRLEQIEEKKKADVKQRNQKKAKDNLQEYVNNYHIFPLDRQQSFAHRQEKKKLPIRR